MMSFIDWITGRSKYLKLLNEQQKLIDDLNMKLTEKKEVITFIQPPKAEEMEAYYFAMNSMYTNRFFKWFMFEIRNKVVAKFIETGEAELHRGQSSMIEVITSTMEKMSTNYQLSKVSKSE